MVFIRIILDLVKVKAIKTLNPDCRLGAVFAFVPELAFKAVDIFSQKTPVIFNQQLRPEGSL